MSNRILALFALIMSVAVFNAGAVVWSFDSGADGWTALSEVQNFQQTGGALYFEYTGGGDPSIGSSNMLTINTASTNTFRIRVNFQPTGGQPDTFQLFFDIGAGFNEDDSVSWTVNQGDNVYSVNLSALPKWTGAVVGVCRQLRLDPGQNGANLGSGTCSIAYMAAVATLPANVRTVNRYTPVGNTPSGPEPNQQNGLTWATAYDTLQEGIDAASAWSVANGNAAAEVWVAEGAYSEVRTKVWGNFPVYGSLVMENNVGMYGGFTTANTSRPGWEVRKQHATTINGATSRDAGGGIFTNAFHVVAVGSQTVPSVNVILDGFTVSGGIASGLAGDYHTWRGGGLFCWISDPLIANCTFSNNEAQVSGGAVSNESNASNTTSPIYENCVFNNNTARAGADTVSNPIRGGGAMLNNRNTIGLPCSPTVLGCTFYNNSASPPNGSGGAIYNWYAELTMDRCIFYDNQSAQHGAGLLLAAREAEVLPSTIENCIFRSNVTSLGDGGGVAVINASPTIVNCTWTGNSAVSGGGLAVGWSTTAIVRNCILWGDAGGGPVTNEINTAIEPGNPGALTVTYSDVQGGYAGVGNINLDPKFRAAPADLRLLGGMVPSPCINPPGGIGSGPDHDVRNFPRPVGGIIDMGAYENAATPVADFTADVTEWRAGVTVQFQNRSETYGFRSEALWSWNFGEGSPSGLENPTHTYNTPGVYTVALTVTTPNESTLTSDTETKTDYIVIHAQPDAEFSGTPLSGVRPLSVTFTGASVADTVAINPAVIESWNWSFGDTTTYSGQTPPVHVYPNQVAMYDVALTVETAWGINTETKLAYIDSWPLALQVTAPDLDEQDATFYPGAGWSNYNGNIITGDCIRIGVVASNGYGPSVGGSYSYQWQFNDGGGWVNLMNRTDTVYTTGTQGVNATPVTRTVSGVDTDTLIIEHALLNYSFTLSPYTMVTDQGSFQCVVTDAGTPPPPNQVTSSSVALSILDLVNVIENPQPAKKYELDSHVFNVKAVGNTGNYAYVWLLDVDRSGPNPPTVAPGSSGATSQWAIFQVTSALEGDILCWVFVNATGSNDTSDRAYFEVNNAVSITAQPGGGHANTGGSFSFTVAATGGYPAYTYQWYKGSANPGNEVGTNSTTLTLGPPLQLTDAGSYLCVVKDDLYVNPPVPPLPNPDKGKATSNTAALTVTDLLAAGNPAPTPQQIYASQGATFTLTPGASGGTPPYAYLWYKGGSPTPLSDGPIYSNTGTAALTISNATLAQTGSYVCVVNDTSPDPNVTTAAGVLTVYANLAVTAVHGISPDATPPNTPLNPIEVNVGQEVTFTVETSGGLGALTYLWAFDDGVAGWQTLANGAHVSGSGSTVSGAATASVKIDPIVTQADAGDYRCTVTDSGTKQQVISGTVVLSVTNNLDVSAPANIRAYTGENAQLSVTAAGGTPPYAYAWYKGTPPTGTYLGGGSDNFYDLPSVTAANAGTYYCVVSDSSGGANPDETSDVATVQVADRPTIVDHPDSLSIYAGYDATFSIAVVNGFLPYTYDWRENGISLGLPTPGEATLELTLVPVAYDGRVYDCRIHDAGSTISGATMRQSTSATLTVADNPLVFDEQPTPLTRAYNDDPAFNLTVAVSGGVAPYNYQWLKDAAPVGANSNALTIDPAVEAPGDYQYQVVVNDAVQPNPSDLAQVEIANHVEFQLDLPDVLNVEPNHNLALQVLTTGGLGDITYTWSFDDEAKAWQVIQVGGSATYQIDHATEDNAGDYRVDVSDEGSTITPRADTISSNVLTLTVEKGVPAAGVFGLAALAVITALGGALTLRRRRS